MNADRNFRIWIFVMIAAILFLMFQALISVAHAATIRGPVNTIFDTLTKVGFKPLWRGSAATGHTTMIYAHSSGSWRAVVVMPDASAACVMASGDKNGLVGISL